MYMHFVVSWFDFKRFLAIFKLANFLTQSFSLEFHGFYTIFFASSIKFNFSFFQPVHPFFSSYFIAKHMSNISYAINHFENTEVLFAINYKIISRLYLIITKMVEMNRATLMQQLHFSIYAHLFFKKDQEKINTCLNINLMNLKRTDLVIWETFRTWNNEIRRIEIYFNYLAN